jgi:hypothetical protein
MPYAQCPVCGFVAPTGDLSAHLRERHPGLDPRIAHPRTALRRAIFAIALLVLLLLVVAVWTNSICTAGCQ